MRATLLLLHGLLATPLLAQCPFDPTITPPAPILCPNDVVMLTTQVYESYQWYKEGIAVPGAVFQNLGVGYVDAGYTFTVLATLDSCSEMSPPVLVDGWAFLPPYVIHQGDQAVIDSMGNAHHCEGDTVLLIFGTPYAVNIQWTNNGIAIPGATDDTLMVTTTGIYHVSGAPDICPNYIAQLGVVISLTFDPATQATIVPNGAQLCASPAGSAYQWYLDGAPIPGSNTPCVQASSVGVYTVEVSYGVVCTSISEPYIVNSVSEHDADRTLGLFPNPTRGAIRVSRGQGTLLGNWSLVDVTGREVVAGRFRGYGDEWLDLAAVPSGRYWLRPQLGADWLPAAITVVR
ncbi:MAG: T9SS type A sorting domain-containing protein [Flavobacteriales bacterium]|nr:T9SS type A sorting domain-containing protein [Flavobacteriales bacterium]